MAAGCFSSQSTFLLFFHLLHQIVLLSLTRTIENKFNFTLGKTFRLSLLCKLVRVKRSKVSRCFVHWLLNHCFPNYDKKQKFFSSFSFYFLPFQTKKKIARFAKFFLRISLWYVSQKNASNFFKKNKRRKEHNLILVECLRSFGRSFMSHKKPFIETTDTIIWLL